MFVSRKKLRIIALVSISILVIVFAFAAISFTNSSTLARSNRQKQTSQSAQRKTIYRTPAIIIPGDSDMNKKIFATMNAMKLELEILMILFP